MRNTYKFHPLYWVVTVFAALLFHHSSQAAERGLATLYSSLAAVETHGLSATYYQSKLQDNINNYGADSINHDAVDGFLTDLVADLRYGITSNQSIDPTSDKAMQINQLATELRRCTDYVACFQSIADRHHEYRPIQNQLANYKAIQHHGGWPTIKAGPTLKAGMQDARVKNLTKLLVMTGDYASTTPSGAYDDALVEAVKRFQARHGLSTDGAVGPATLKAMNIPVSTRITQLEMSLERLRQLPNMPQGHHIRVNIPSYRLHAYNGDTQMLNMDVIVGKVSRPTPLFDNHINTLVMNPTWTPTTKILNKDILPKVRNDPAYLTNGNYVVKDRYTGETLDPYAVDWQSASAADVRVVQKAGSRNALGKIKFLLPQNDAVYLHDTSSPSLFNKSYRALSAGCIRLSDPEALLSYVAQAQNQPEFNNVVDYYKSSKSRTMKVANPIPVKMTYFTAWINEAGEPTFYDDVYKKDARLELALAKHGSQYALR